MAVYLLHFERAYRHARHYLGYAQNLEERLQRHRAGNGARLIQVIRAAGIDFVVARVWSDGDRHLERRLKRWHKTRSLCPMCRAPQRRQHVTARSKA